MIKYMLKKYNINDYYFVYDKTQELETLIVVIDPLNAYDVVNKKVINNFGFDYKIQLRDYVDIKETFISIRQAKKVAKPYFEQFRKYLEKNGVLDKHGLRHFVEKQIENPVTYIDLGDDKWEIK